jgi:uncharacterized protein
MSIIDEYDPSISSVDGDEVPSPCISICKIEASSGLCVGCYRTVEEITLWRGASNDRKRQIWLLVKSRSKLGDSNNGAIQVP